MSGRLAADLKRVLSDYGARIVFSCSDCSDTHGIYNARIEVQDSGGGVVDWSDGYSLSANDISDSLGPSDEQLIAWALCNAIRNSSDGGNRMQIACIPEAPSVWTLCYPSQEDLAISVGDSAKSPVICSDSRAAMLRAFRAQD